MTELIDETIAAFGRSIGMEGLRLRENGALVLEMTNIGTLCIECIGEYRDQVSVSIARNIEPPDAEACKRILELCHYRNQAPWEVHAGFNSRGGLVFAVGMVPADFNLPNMHEAIDWLDGLHQQIHSSVRLVQA
jgi:type III secretion system chaperone SycN